MVESKVYDEHDKLSITVSSGIDDPLKEFETLPKAEEYVKKLYEQGKRNIEVIIKRRYYKRLRYGQS